MPGECWGQTTDLLGASLPGPPWAGPPGRDLNHPPVQEPTPREAPSLHTQLP